MCLALFGACAALPAPGPSSSELLAQGDRFFDQRRHEDARSAYEFAVVKADSEGERGTWVEASAQIAHLLALRQETQLAAEWLARARARLEPQDSAAQARVLLASGALARARGEASARSFFEQAYAVALAAELYDRALQAAYMVCLCVDGSERVRWAEQCLDVVARSGHSEWRAAVQMVLAAELEREQRFDDAAASYTDAQLAFSKRGDLMRQGLATLGLCRMLRALKRDAEAQAELQPLLNATRGRYATGGSQWCAELLARAYLEGVELALASGQPAAAQQLLAEAYSDLRQAGLDRAAPSVAERLNYWQNKLRPSASTEPASISPDS